MNQPVQARPQASLLALVPGLTCLIAAMALSRSAPSPRDVIVCQSSADCSSLDLTAVCYQTVRGGRCESGLPTAPTAQALSLAMLSRSHAAADLAWMRTLQFIGAPWAEQVDYSGLERWLNVVVDLDPGFADAYIMGGILLATIPTRAEDADALLQKAEANLTTRRQLSQIAHWRAFVAHYGMFDLARAAEHYQRSFDLGGPPVVGARARTLRGQSADCKTIWESLSEGKDNTGFLVGAALVDQSRRKKIIQNCFQAQINAALATRRVGPKGDATDVQELVEDGYLPAIPPTFDDGSCWTVINSQAFLRPCLPPPGPQP